MAAELETFQQRLQSLDERSPPCWPRAMTPAAKCQSIDQDPGPMPANLCRNSAATADSGQGPPPRAAGFPRPCATAGRFFCAGKKTRTTSNSGTIWKPATADGKGSDRFDMRIIGGSAGGILLNWRPKAPKGFEVRPTPDLVRQAVFNSLGPRVQGARVLELFAGTGALSLECLSRGAANALCVEKSAATPNSSAWNLEQQRATSFHPPACPPPEPAHSRARRLHRHPAIGRRTSTIRFDPGRPSLRREKRRTPLHLLRPTIAGRARLAGPVASRRPFRPGPHQAGHVEHPAGMGGNQTPQTRRHRHALPARRRNLDGAGQLTASRGEQLPAVERRHRARHEWRQASASSSRRIFTAAISMAPGPR
jgi:hypothetical protein